jgi:hypothetical protein
VAPLITSALAGVLVAATLSGRYALAGGVALVQAVLLLGLVRAWDAPAARTCGVVALLAGLATAGVLVLRDPTLELDALLPLAPAAGLGLVAVAVVQLARRDGRARLTASLTFGVTAVVVVVALVMWLALWSDPAGAAALLLALAGVATAAAFAVFPGPPVLWVLGGTVAAAGVGLLVQSYAPQATQAAVYPGPAVVLAAASGLAAAGGLWVTRLVLADVPAGTPAPTGATAALLTAAVPLVLAAPVAYGLGWSLLA